MYMKVTQGRVSKGTWKEFEASYKSIFDRHIDGLVKRFLISDIDDHDSGQSISIWESLDALRAYEASNFFSHEVKAALQPFHDGHYQAKVSEIVMQS